MSEHVRWGILSTANIGDKAVVPAIGNSNNGQLQAVASRSLDSAEQFAAKHNILQAQGSYEQLLENADVDAIYIPLPNHMHLEWTLRAIEAGKHVLCEKPIALNAGEVQQMVDAAQEARVVLMEAFMYRFHPRSGRVKELVESGAIGNVRLVHAAFCYRASDPDNIRFKPEMGGGALMDVGCYGVSLARWMFGQEPEEVQASAEYGPSDVDVNFAGILSFAGGGKAMVEASFTSSMQQVYSVVGLEGAIDVRRHNAFIPWEDETVFYKREPDDEVGEAETISGVDEYKLMVEHFADVVLGKAERMFPDDDSIKNMRVLDALAEAAREKRTVQV